MNILWLSQNVPYPPTTGALQRNYNLLKGVASRHNVYLIAFNQKALLPTEREVEEANKALKKLCAHVEILPIPSDASKVAWYKLVLLSLLTRDPYTVNWLKSNEMHSKIKEAMHKIKFDLVHYSTISLVEYVNDAANLPKVLDHHNIESFMMRRRSEKEKNMFKKVYFYCEAWKLQSVEKLYASNVGVNLTVSRLDAEKLRSLYPEANVELCENGSDTTYFMPDNRVSPEVGHLLFVGGLDWYPNRDAMLYFCKDVWPQLIREKPNVKLTIVGAHPPESLKQVAVRDHRIRLVGYVDDVRPYFQKADIFICPIRDGGGTRLKILNAMAMGKQIITTSIGCEGIDLIPGKDVLIADTPEDFVKQVQWLLSNPTLKSELGMRGRKLVEEKYSWDTIAMRLLTIYDKVVELQNPCVQ